MISKPPAASVGFALVRVLLLSAKHLFFAANCNVPRSRQHRPHIPYVHYHHPMHGTTTALEPRTPGVQYCAVRWPGPLDDPVSRGTHRVAC